ncbi:MAG: hypothetical protein RI894_629 [Bacteroidota bacterium]|jgi:hypothetical protein
MSKKIYKLSEGLEIFASVGAVALIGLAIALFYIDGIGFWLSIGMATFLGYWGVFLALYVYRCKVIIDDEKITSYTSFGKQILHFKDIKGYRVKELGYGRTAFTLESHSGETTITINDNNWIGALELRGYFMLYPNLEEADKRESRQAILTDEAHGATIEDRERRLHFFKRVSESLSFGAIGILFLMCFDSKPYLVWGWYLIFFPIAGLAIHYRSKGLVKLLETNNTVKPDLGGVFLSAPIGLLIPLAITVNLLDYSRGLWFSLGFSVVLSLLIYFISNDFNSKQPNFDYFKNIAALWAGCWVYAFGVFTALNISLDRSTPKIHKADITELSHHVKSFVLSEYRVDIQSNEAIFDSTSLYTTSTIYNTLKPNERIVIAVYQGFFGTRFAEIVGKETIDN